MKGPHSSRQRSRRLLLLALLPSLFILTGPHLVHASGPQNLALLAVATADSSWINPPPRNYPYDPLPGRGNNGINSDTWVGRFGIRCHWYRLQWPKLLTMNRIFVTNDHWERTSQTITSICFRDPASGKWETIPGTFKSYGQPQCWADFRFPRILTDSILVNLQTGPDAPHPNLAVFINEIEVYDSEQPLI